ncbi:uncharacterized protein K444DRAFT_612844 [Hyaloscypha bicolor E]|uniref:Zn(2)-C6 fungal-type domain-containing protein n=1 Tax=Hyaloscypha bicolor E TaxID=1095630 RepID=A0A2J6TB64_9HELO|nr:uncharacterized protein K444DRAFT_612844 [Hyaloscypha bicolor E]PMD60269.1 hypothetical protein K444DRAFT_612844 [Hyaloscypha bicolor E]
MGRRSGESKKKAGRTAKAKPGCLTCEERGLTCDETLPTCQHCQQSGRVCKGLRGRTGLWGKTSTSPGPAFMVGMDHSKLSSNPPKQTASEGDLVDGANRESSKKPRTGKRTADAVPLPEARTTGSPKRARSRKDEQQDGDCITVSFESMENHKHPNRSPASEATMPTAQSDVVECQSHRQVSSEDSNAMQKARLALSAVETSRWTKPSQGNTPPDSRTKSNSASTHSPTSDSRPLEITEIDNTGLSGQARNPPNDPSPPARGPSDLHVPASSEQQSFSSVPVEAEQDPGRPWNSPRVDTHSQAVETERRPLMSGSFGGSSVAGTGRSASFDNIPPPPDSTHYPASMQDAGSRLFQPQMITTDPARGNRPSDSLNTSQHLESVSISSSNATTPATHHHRAPPPSQASSNRPALTFTIDGLQGELPWSTMRPFVEVFTRNGDVLLQSRTLIGYKVYPMEFIMWPKLRDFHRWYMTETGTTDVLHLRIEMYNAESKLENIFVISRDNAHHLPVLRQYIWDFFWTASSLNNTSTFKVVVRDARDAECGATALVLPAERSTTSRARTIGLVADSRPPAAQVCGGYPPRHNKVTAHTISSVAPRALAPKIVPTAAQMHIPEIKYPGSSMGVAAYVPQNQPEDARDLSSRQTAIAAVLAPEIAVRVQTDGAGKVSARYSKWVLRPEITTADFFAWFAHQTGRGGSNGPPSLRFTLKDAMPAPTSSTIAQADEDHFNLMKRDLKTQFEKAGELVPNLKEFLVLVTDPDWVSEEDW